MFRGDPADLHTVAGIAGEALSLRPRGMIQLGLLMLIAIPVTRVAFSAVVFALQRDGVYVAVTLIVLSILLHGLAGGP